MVNEGYCWCGDASMLVYRINDNHRIDDDGVLSTIGEWRSEGAKGGYVLILSWTASFVPPFHFAANSKMPPTFDLPSQSHQC